MCVRFRVVEWFAIAPGLSLHEKKENSMDEKKKNLWSLIVKVIIAVATTVAGALGIRSCM